MHDKSGKQVIEYGIVPIGVMASMSGLDFVRANFKGSAVCACDDDLPCVRISEGERVDQFIHGALIRSIHTQTGNNSLSRQEVSHQLAELHRFLGCAPALNTGMT